MTWGQRLESSAAGQAFLSLVMVVLIAGVVLWNLPAGRAHDAAHPVAGVVLQSLGLEQDWALFAPEPRAFGVGVVARVTHRDGRVETWVPPHNGRFVTPYRNYRWQKYVERLRADDYAAMWEPTARWIAQQAGKDVVKVVLTRSFRDVAVPGEGKARPAAGHYDFYTLDLP